MSGSQAISPEAMKKIVAELEKGKKSLDDLVRTLNTSDGDAEKLEQVAK